MGFCHLVLYIDSKNLTFLLPKSCIVNVIFRLSFLYDEKKVKCDQIQYKNDTQSVQFISDDDEFASFFPILLLFVFSPQKKRIVNAINNVIRHIIFLQFRHASKYRIKQEAKKFESFFHLRQFLYDVYNCRTSGLLFRRSE